MAAIQPRNIPQSFKRTKMCTFHMAGNCARGDLCDFAHGDDDVKPLPNLWKTKLCKSFMRTGSCPNLDECTYAHSHAEQRPSELKTQVRDRANTIGNYPAPPVRDRKMSDRPERKSSAASDRDDNKLFGKKTRGRTSSSFTMSPSVNSGASTASTTPPTTPSWSPSQDPTTGTSRLSSSRRRSSGFSDFSITESEQASDNTQNSGEFALLMDNFSSSQCLPLMQTGDYNSNYGMATSFMVFTNQQDMQMQQMDMSSMQWQTQMSSSLDCSLQRQITKSTWAGDETRTYDSDSDFRSATKNKDSRASDDSDSDDLGYSSDPMDWKVSVKNTFLQVEEARIVSSRVRSRSTPPAL
eukprot:TRINITY_DN94726_c0_g1_i1.p1 TRINITY_DN94726_c0_g1~~TRINITY_DN94726_c0_g1_i1.p1  ORF type:complete len:353 (+),score=63.85 TRINITY_DN94726_c0_g1_i1:35-1093(+)